MPAVDCCPVERDYSLAASGPTIGFNLTQGYRNLRTLMMPAMTNSTSAAL
jgi:hypothetical protein